MNRLNFYQRTVIAAALALIGSAAVAQITQNTTTQFQYDANGNVTQITDPLGRVTTETYDPLNRLKQQVLPAPNSGAPLPTISYTYDGRNQVATVTDPRNLTTTYTTDGLGNQTALASPDAGTTSKTFDANGSVKTSTDAKGQVTTYTYDVLNRVTQISYSSGTSTVFEYDGGSAGGTNNVGHLTKMIDESGQTTYAFDGFGHLITKVQTVGTGTGAKVFTTSYAYGASGTVTGKLISMTYPSGNRVNYAYDAAGRINSVILNPANLYGGGTNTGANINLLTGIGYSPFGVVQSWVWGNSTSTNVNTYARGTDLDGRITSYPLGNGLTNGLNRSLTYDAASRINAANHTGTGTGVNAPANYDQSLGYDNLDRLTNFGRTNTSNTFQYDATGNRTTSDVGSGTSTDTIAAGSNQLASITTPAGATTNRSYDADGSLTSDGAVTFTYSARGRMQSTTGSFGVTSYNYNGIGQRVVKSGPPIYVRTGSNYYDYDEQGHLVGEYAVNGPIGGGVFQETVYLGDLPVAVLKQVFKYGNPSGMAPDIYYVYADHINAPRVITRVSDNTIVWRWDYTDPFGVQHPNENPSNLGSFTYNPRFPGQLYDQETNLFYNYFRDYDPQTGRYIESDPKGLSGGLNMYGYAGGNPVTRIDPNGLVPIFSHPELMTPEDKAEYIAMQSASAVSSATSVDTKGANSTDKVVKVCFGKPRDYVHQWLCVGDTCGGLVPNGGKGIGGGDAHIQKEDPKDGVCSTVPPACDEMKFQQCIARNVTSSKGGYYNLLFANCIYWTYDVVLSCEVEACGK